MSSSIAFPIAYLPLPNQSGANGLGSLYIGVPDGDPVNTPADRIQVYIARQGLSDLAISQPIALSAGGIPLYNGSPVTLKISSAYSMAVLDYTESQIYYCPKAGEEAGEISSLDTRLTDLESEFESFTSNLPVLKVGTVEQLRALTGLVAGQEISLTEYFAGYGTGGGDFYYDSTDTTSADNGVSVFVAGTARIKRKQIKQFGPLDGGAKGDGVADDTAIFSSFETLFSGKIIDLQGRTFKVTSIPNENTYYNGKWVVSGRTVIAPFNDSFAFPGVRCTRYGGQLAKLRKALSNPFEQFTGIAFLGDSITWGATLPENLSPGSDLTTLATRRDLFVSPSFVNEFKRWIGKNYFDNATPVISNWAASSAGEAIAEYTKYDVVYTNRTPFVFTDTGSATATDTSAASSISGYQAVYAVSAGANEASIVFPFTGSKFSLVFTCVDSDAPDYQVLVDGVSIGTFGTSVADGFVDGSYGNKITHTFDYVRNKNIEIVISGAGYPSIRRLRVEGLEIPKTVRITNQGISGSNSTRYKDRALKTTFLPDIAVTPQDNFAFLMLGTNDRLDPTWPQGLNSFEEEMKEILDILDPLCDTVIMCANSVSDSNQAGKRFTMQQIRGSLCNVSESRSHDFVDNYAIFHNANPDTVLADGLHPNVLGHYMIFRNIADSLES